jgi:hypothetical protein
MADLKFNKGIDEEHEVKLNSYLISSFWSSAYAFAGASAKLEVRTALVGNGAKIQITGKSEGGKKLGKIKDIINNNVFVGQLDIPEDVETGDEIYFEVKLSKNSLDGESNRIPVYPQPKIKSIGWSAEEARRGDILELTAELEDVNDGAEVLLVIYEYDEDGAHDKITELPASIEKGKIKIVWEYEYHEDTDEIPTQEEMERYGGSYNPPEYFFTIKFEEFELAREQESKLLKFKDYIEINLKDPAGNPVADEKYIVHLPDGTEKQGNLDAQGYAKEDGIPPGIIQVEFPDLEQVDSERPIEE